MPFSAQKNSPSGNSLWREYPLPTLIIQRKTGEILFANKAFDDFFNGPRTSFDHILERLIRDEAQRLQCLRLLQRRMMAGRMYWCPAVLSPGSEAASPGVVQVWRHTFEKHPVQVLHFMIQPPASRIEASAFAPESTALIESGAVRCCFNSAAHAAYNLWLLLDRISSGIVLIDSGDRIFGVNRTVKKQYGYTSSAVRTIHEWWERVHFAAGTDEVIADAVAGRKAFGPLRTKILCADGARRTVLVEFLRMPGEWRSLIYEDLPSPAPAPASMAQLVQELQDKHEKIQELHIAFKTLLEQRNADKKELWSNVCANLNEFILPYLERLDMLSTSDIQKKILEMIRNHLADIATSFSRDLAAKKLALTPRELQIANMLASGLTTKDIAGALCISPDSVGYYRNNLRRKLGIVDKKVNLKARLLGLGLLEAAQDERRGGSEA